jgi:hypothetical protein
MGTISSEEKDDPEPIRDAEAPEFGTSTMDR